MQHQRCLCPHCGATLRVKDRVYLNRPIPCPDCRTLLVIVALANDHLEAHLADVPTEIKTPTNPSARLSDSLKRQDWTPNVIVISWLAAFTVGVLILGAALWPRNSRILPVAKSDAVDEHAEPAQLDSRSSEPEPGPIPAEPIVVSTPVESPMTEPEDPPIEPLLAVEAAEAVDALDAVASAPVVAVVPAAPMPKVDLEAALAQPLREFRQTRSVPRKDLLFLLEELLGAPIRYDAKQLSPAALSSLDKSISFELDNVTVGQVLERVLANTGLTTEPEPTGLRVREAVDEKNSERN